MTGYAQDSPSSGEQVRFLSHHAIFFDSGHFELEHYVWLRYQYVFNDDDRKFVLSLFYS